MLLNRKYYRGLYECKKQDINKQLYYLLRVKILNYSREQQNFRGSIVPAVGPVEAFEQKATVWRLLSSLPCEWSVFWICLPTGGDCPNRSGWIMDLSWSLMHWRGGLKLTRLNWLLLNRASQLRMLSWSASIEPIAKMSWMPFIFHYSRGSRHHRWVDQRVQYHQASWSPGEIAALSIFGWQGINSPLSTGTKKGMLTQPVCTPSENEAGSGRGYQNSVQCPESRENWGKIIQDCWGIYTVHFRIGRLAGGQHPRGSDRVCFPSGSPESVE